MFGRTFCEELISLKKKVPRFASESWSPLVIVGRWAEGLGNFRGGPECLPGKICTVLSPILIGFLRAPSLFFSLHNARFGHSKNRLSRWVMNSEVARTFCPWIRDYWGGPNDVCPMGQKFGELTNPPQLNSKRNFAADVHHFFYCSNLKGKATYVIHPFWVIRIDPPLKIWRTFGILKFWEKWRRTVLVSPFKLC